MDQPETKPETIPTNGKIKKLTPKQQRFVEEYCTDWNATQSAIRSGYSPDTARQIGHALLMNIDMQQAIDAHKAALTEKCLVSNEYIIGLLRDVAETGAQKISVKGQDDGVKRMLDPASVAKSAELMGKHAGTWEADNAQKDHGVQVLIQQYAGNASDVGQLGPPSGGVQVHSDEQTRCIEGNQDVLEGQTIPTDEADDQ